VIFGAGGLGLMALSLLKAMGGKGAIVVDIDARKREAAEKAGALATVDGAAPMRWRNSRPRRRADPIRDRPRRQCRDRAVGFDCLTKGGKLVMVGLFGGGAPWRCRCFRSRHHHPGQLCRQFAREPRNCSLWCGRRRSRRSR